MCRRVLDNRRRGSDACEGGDVVQRRGMARESFTVRICQESLIDRGERGHVVVVNAAWWKPAR